MKKILSLLLCAAMLLGVTACGAKDAGKFTPGTYTATAKGFGGDVTVTLTVDSSKITAVDITGDSETAGIGSKAVAEMPKQILDAQSAEVDGVSGATYTSGAIKEAAKSALDEAMGVAATTSTMKDGTYTATTPSYAQINGLMTTGSMSMTVTVKDNKFESIVVDDFTDTDVIGGMAYPILIDSVLKYQSLGVDSVSGATVSSNAFFTALSDCVTQAGGTPSVLQAVEVPSEAPKTAEYNTDILVIGAGMAGLSAAIEAAQEGANVILLEKNDVYSSSTTRSLGYVVGAGTDTQKAAGITDDADAFYHDISSLYAGEPELDTGLLRVMADNSADLNSWLTNLGVTFTGVINKSEKGERLTKRIHTTDGGSYVTSKLVAAAEAAGVTVMLGTPATSLIQESDGSISGAMATNEAGDTLTIHSKATIVAAGSYTNNEALFKELNPRIDNITYSCGCGEGDAYNWFVAVGADIVEIPYTQFMYYSYAASFAQFPEVIPNAPDGPAYNVLLVTGGGERVTAEDNFCFEFTKENWNRGYNEGYAVVGQSFADQYPILMSDVLENTVPSTGLPYAYKEDTIEALAADVGIDAATLAATVARYNELCDKGEDTDFGKDAKYMEKIEAPYYVIRLPQVTTDGYTGARINEHAQVLDKSGNWIPGLYAAGSCADGQTVSVNYFGCGTSLLTCGVFGREAAKDAVSRLNK